MKTQCTFFADCRAGAWSLYTAETIMRNLFDTKEFYWCRIHAELAMEMPQDYAMFSFITDLDPRGDEIRQDPRIKGWIDRAMAQCRKWEGVEKAISY